jgi:signal transduction histidine kinase
MDDTGGIRDSALVGDEPAAQRLGRVIGQNQAEIERRWLERVEGGIALKTGVEPTHLRDGLPDYLTALVKLFSRPNVEHLDLAAEPSWSRVAREHGITRVRIGFNITQLIQEFIVLRRVIRELAHEQDAHTEGLEALLADTLDAAIAASVSAYVDARDYDTRRRQAANVGFLTHELRNPLSTAVLTTSALRRQAGAESAPLLDKLERNHKRLSELIDSVLLTEKLESGKVESRPVTITIGQLMEPALETARATATSKGLSLHIDYDPSIQVHADPILTRSAVQNLADNAVNYTDQGEVAIKVDDSADELTVHFRDTCDGISAEELRIIFEPFERGRTSKSGTGLGLAIARHAIEAQGGTIHAESPERSGCHFWIALPKSTVARGQE